VSADIAAQVRTGLLSVPKVLPPHLFYDDEGSALYERITGLPEYYLTRAEREILEAHATEIVALAAEGLDGALRVVELGAGSASKTEVLLRALVARQGHGSYIPIDVSPAAVGHARRRLRAVLPEVHVTPLITTHEEAPGTLKRLAGPRSLVLFIGSSIGNFEDHEASAILRGVGEALGPGTRLVLGTDLRKSPDVLVRAYDDAAGVTAAFNKNLLRRINRELGGHFDLERFRHVACWNEAASRIEMHLQSTVMQEVAIDGLLLCPRFEAGETIHTESSIKYDLPRVRALLGVAGFRLDHTFHDEARRFALHLARAL